MAGSMRLIRNKDVWQLRVYVGRDSEGRVRHVHRSFRGSRRAAERELAMLIAAQELEPAPIPEDPVEWGPTTTINDAIAAWRDNGWSDLSPNTAYDYATVWRVHIQGSIGRQRIASLSPFDIERFLRGLKEKGLSKHRVQRVRAVLHRACRLARKWSGNFLPNPVADSDMPVWSLAEGSDEVRAPALSEVAAILREALAYDLRIAAFVRLVAVTGIRRGEACALRWSDVDASRRVLSIDKSIVIGRDGAEVKAPKTRASVRMIAVDEETLRLLASLQRHQEEVARECGAEVADGAFVFSVEPDAGRPPRPDTLTHAFAHLRDRAGVARDLHLHSLRHFAATELDSVISESQKQSRLGWSTVHMARHYTGTVPEEDRRAAEHMGHLLGGTGDPERPQTGQRPKRSGPLGPGSA